MPPIWIHALGSFLQGCAPLSVGLKDEIPQKRVPTERKGNADHVQFLVGLTMEDFDYYLPDIEGKDLFLNMFAQSVGNKIDNGWEAVHIARYFVQEASQRSLIDINEKDIDKYEKQLAREEWESRRVEIKKGFRIENIHHPFIKAIDDLPIYHMTDFRSTRTFLHWADPLLQALGRIPKNRSLTILYPGSGSHIAPLITAMQLIERETIDRAEFIYTEIYADIEEDLRFLLDKLVGRGVFEKFSVGPWVTFENEGKERVFEVIYRGKPIRILLALNRSGEEYYRLEYLERSDAVILHDPGRGHLTDSYDLLAKMLLQKKSSFSKKGQLIIMEGEEPTEGQSHFPEGMQKEILEGPYGHCDGGANGVGEVAHCNIAFARSFFLNDPMLSELVLQHNSPLSLSRALFTPNDLPQMKVCEPGTPP